MVDVHMSLDGVVVICHDALLQRLYGVDAEVTSLPWKNGLDRLRTIREPHSPMLKFRQLCEKIAIAEGANGVGGTRTAWKDAWILMDIKVCAILYAKDPWHILRHGNIVGRVRLMRN